VIQLINLLRRLENNVDLVLFVTFVMMIMIMKMFTNMTMTFLVMRLLHGEKFVLIRLEPFMVIVFLMTWFMMFIV
jgi:hypothetical protein